MGRLLRQIATRLLATLGVVVILLALALGAFRVLIAQLPSYQSELKAWVANELGLDVDFDELDARLGLAGPELTLHGASIGVGGSERAFLEAERAGVAIDPWQLLLERKVVVARLTLDGVRVTVERAADGRLTVSGVPGGDAGLDSLVSIVPPAVEVVVRDSRLLYIDLPRRRSWQFLDVDIALDRDPERLAVTASAHPPAELAADVEFDLVADLGTDNAPGDHWRASSALTDLDLGVMARLLPTQGSVELGGTGDLAVEVEWADDHFAAATVDASLANVALASARGGAEALYDRLRFSAGWHQDAERNWRLTVGEVEVEREGRGWYSGDDSQLSIARGGGELRRVALNADYVRLEDLAPAVRAFEDTQFAEQWALLDPRGALAALDVSVERAGIVWDYSIGARFEELGLNGIGDMPGVSGLSGDVRADARSGTVTFDSGDLLVEWPAFFPTDLSFGGLQGTVVWRQGREGLRVISNDLGIGLFERVLDASFDLTLPGDGAPPLLDLEARFPDVDLVAAKRLLPTPKMPAPVVKWLDAAVLGGRGSDIELDFYGPLTAFPFDEGEGQFRVSANVTNVALAFVEDWPRAEDLTGRLEFVNAGFNAHGRGRVLGNRSDNIEVGIADMRQAVLTVAADTNGPLGDVMGFVRGAPLIAKHLGSGFDRVRADAGEGSIRLDLSLPLLELDRYALDSSLTIVDGALSIDGFGPKASEINGRLEIDETVVTGQSIQALFVGGPVTAAVSAATLPGYRSVLSVEGETTADAVLEAFDLPFGDLFGGQTIWTGRLLLPSTSEAAPPPTRIDIQSNLSGVALRFPQPLSKPASEPTNMQIGFVFDASGRLEVAGNLGATRRFALDYGIDGGRFRFMGGAIAFGGDEPVALQPDGIWVSGRLPTLNLGDWLALAKTTSIDRARPLFLGADLDVTEFNAFGQHLGSTSLDVTRGQSIWEVNIDSQAIAGRIVVPQDLSARAQIVARMDRVYLAAGEGIGIGDTDPRDMPGLRLFADEFGFGNRRLGRIDADVVADPLGLRLVAFSSQSDSYSAEGSGSWLDRPNGSITRIAASVSSTDVLATLEELGMDPVVEGEMGDLTASVYWDGPPSGRWLDHINGDVSLRIETGSLVEIDPGAGRVVGLMSIAALPRRLVLDFRDVFNKGFVFDEITGGFTILDGNAYTNNLLMSGPGAEVGVVGRTGLRDRDYQQQAVVTAEPGNVLPTVGAVLGGAGVGAALLIFTRLFKEPLKGIGRAAYCVTGSWDEPAVERIEANERERAEACVELPAVMSELEDE